MDQEKTMSSYQSELRPRRSSRALHIGRAWLGPEDPHVSAKKLKDKASRCDTFRLMVVPGSSSVSGGYYLHESTAIERIRFSSHLSEMSYISDSDQGKIQFYITLADQLDTLATKLRRDAQSRLRRLNITPGELLGLSPAMQAVVKMSFPADTDRLLSQSHIHDALIGLFHLKANM